MGTDGHGFEIEQKETKVAERENLKSEISDFMLKSEGGS